MLIIGACNCLFTSKSASSLVGAGGLNVGELISSSLRYTIHCTPAEVLFIL